MKKLPWVTYQLKDTYKKIPGVKWDQSQKSWVGPNEFGEGGAILPVTTSLNAEYQFNSIPTHYRSQLKYYQLNAISQALKSANSFMFRFDTGLGKTFTALVFCLARGFEHVLVVTPVAVKHVWEQEVLTKCPELKDFIQITSYTEIEKTPPTSISTIDCIILDESHFIKNKEAKRSKKIKELADKAPTAFRLCLTGTPLSKDPQDLWAQLDWMEGTFGSWFQFREYYCEWDEVQYYNPHLRKDTSKFDNIRFNKDRQWHLQERLKHFVYDVKASQVRELLPPLTIIGEPVLTQYSIDKLIKELEASSSPICVLTHEREEAQRIGKMLNRQIITGSTSAESRYHAIDRTKSLVATMHSVGVGIDLTAYKTVVFAQYDYSPTIMVQAMGRFCRLNNPNPVTIHMPVQQGTDSERKVLNLMSKIGDMETAGVEGENAGILRSTMKVMMRDANTQALKTLDFNPALSDTAHAFIDEGEDSW